MKTITAILVLLLGMGANQLLAQSKVKVKGNQIYVNKIHEFDIYTVGGFSINEATVKNKLGNVVLTFILGSRPNGYRSSTSYDSKGRQTSSSGTTYLYYYRIADGNGNYCEVKIDGLQSIRGMAIYLINNNIMRNGELDSDVFTKFCLVHGSTFSGGY